MHGNQKGFTLMELMVVIVIVAILAAVAVPLYINYVNDARRTEAKAAIGAIITAEHAYYLRSPDLLGTGVPTYTSDLAELQRVGLDITDADRTWDFTITRADESGFAVSAVLTTTASSSNPIAVDYTYTRGESGSFTP